MLTVERLVAESGLALAAGAKEAAGRSLRWVHISEHADPTPWLSGGELLLTTGPSLDDAESQRAYAALLAGHGVAGLGFGTGFDHPKLPGALVKAAAAHGLPLFEVPYEMPFIAITERAAAALINEQFDVLERGSKVHERLERLVIDGGGLGEILTAITGSAGGAALVYDSAGALIERHPARGTPNAEQALAIATAVAARTAEGQWAAFPVSAPGLGEALALPVPGRRGAALPGWLVVVSERGPLGEFERLIARQASLVVGLELMRERVVRETERRLAGDLLADILGGRLGTDELAGRLRPFGIGAQAAIVVFETPDPATSEPALEAALAAAGVPALVATSQGPAASLLCAVVAAGERDPVAIATEARAALAPIHKGLRAGVSRVAGVGALRRAFHEARCALVATAHRNGDAPDVASHSDLGAFTLLLALQDEDALRLYADGLLEPIEGGEGEYGGELLRSLEAFIAHNGNWERAARQLFCHRHTLRYRIRKIEELTGRDLSAATDRIELWLALRAKELVG